MTAAHAKVLLVRFRPAVAIVLLWANCVWAQGAPGQRADLLATERITTDTDAESAEKPGVASDYAPAGEEDGPLRGIALRLSAGIGYDDNVFRTERNTRSDYYWLVRPAVVFNFAAAKHGFNVGYEGAYATYFEHSTEDYYDHLLFANAGLDLSRKVDLNLGAEIAYGHDPRGSLGNRLIVPGDLDRWFGYAATAELVIGREIARAQIIPSVEFSGKRYLNNNQSIRDFDRQDARLRGSWRFTPKFYGIAEGGFANIDHLDSRNTLNRTETDFLVGFGWLATAKTSGEVLYGVLYRNYDDWTTPSNTNPTWDVRVHWEPKTYSKVTAYTRRSSQENAGGVGNFLADSYGALWRHDFNWRTSLNTSINYTIADFNSGREDKYVTFNLGLTYKLTSWLDAGATYEYLHRRSNIPPKTITITSCSLMPGWI
jgi:hypothetical protein